MQARDVGPIPNALAYSNLKTAMTSVNRDFGTEGRAEPYHSHELVMGKVMPYDVQFSKDFRNDEDWCAEAISVFLVVK